MLAVNSAGPLLALSGKDSMQVTKAAAEKQDDKQDANEQIVSAVQFEAVIPFLKFDLDNDLLSELAPAFFEIKERRFYRSYPLSTSRYFKNLFTDFIAINAP